ncbi:MAG: hypothetical protein AAF430_05345 [Myxococcota bacterium]
MKSQRLLTRCARITASSFLLLALALPATAVIVEFTSTSTAGIGDGGNPATIDVSPNGLPICNMGLQPHLNASIPAAGFADVGTVAPRSLMAVRPFKYGPPGATTGNATIMARPGVAGVNGAAQYASSTCNIPFPTAFLPAILAGRTQFSRFTGPADNAITTTTTAMGKMNFMVTTMGLEDHHLRAGGGPGNFTFMVPTVLGTPMQTIMGTAGANTFGGGWRGSGGGRVNLAVNAAPGVVISGYWLTGPRKGGHNDPVNTQLVTQSGLFTNLATMGVAPVTLRAWNARFTTGMVKAEDNGGQFITIRTQTGGDNRTGPSSSMGTLLLVTPFTASLIPFLGGAANLYFGGTATTRFNFLPEPGPTALLAAGVLGVIALHLLARRRK